MKKIYFFLLLVFSSVHAFSQNVSNEGRNFYAVFPSHDPSNGNLANITVFVTAKANTVATVSCGQFTQTQNIPANTAVPFQVPRLEAYVDITQSNTVIPNRAIKVSVAANQPKVAVYAHIWAGARSAASLILPFEALGQTYYSMNYTQNSGTASYLVLVAAEDNTDLLIREKNGNIVPVTLPRAGDVYEYVSAQRTDLTGVFVEVDKTTSSCKRFAAFSGSTSLTILCGSSADPLYQQLYTTNSWGKTFGIVPFLNRAYTIRVLAKEINTQVQFNGSVVTLANEGDFFDFPILSMPGMLNADKPVSVAQYSLTSACSGAGGGAMLGDPEMVLLNPYEFSIKGITMFSSDLQAITEKYINVFIKTTATSTFKLNGNAITGWRPMPDDASYSYVQINVSAASLTLTASQSFNAIAYGYGNVESYAYSAGTSLAANQFASVQNVSTNVTTPEACINETYKIKVALTTQATKIVWKLDDGTEIEDASPTAVPSTVNNQVFYNYTFNTQQTYTQAGTQTITATVDYPVSGGCFVGQQEFVFDIVVNPLPTASYTYTGNCSTRQIEFKDTSTVPSNTPPITKWAWDFGDGGTSTEQNPKHAFSPGDHIVKLIVASDAGCFSAVFTSTITIQPTPVASFTVNQNSCVQTTLTFADASTVGTGSTITKWKWDFGDGTIEDKTVNTNITHSYVATGTYTVKLIVESDKGCVSDVFTRVITITALPVADFNVPEVCLTDAMAVFKNNSLNSDGNKAGLTYLWNFGDNSAAPGTNTSTLENGSHKYFSAGTYTVTLTLTNQNGCVVVLQKPFTVNGDTPVAGFEVQNASELCSSKKVTVKNTSVVNFGSVTRLEFYPDLLNDPSRVVVDEEPVPGKLYEFEYPLFSVPLTRNITIKVRAYSGSVNGSCFKEYTEVIVLKASPVVVFTALAPICLNAGTRQFLQATETGNSIGAGIYSGNGVSATGLFNPITAGVGTHKITYTFTNNNGCTDVKTQDIVVNDIPAVDAGADLFLLQGGQLTLRSTASGSNLTYKWTPSTGLDRDDVLNPVTTAAEDTEYTLTVTSDVGCTVTDKIKVTVLKGITPFNSFTPNGDGINDVWNISYLESYPSALVEIFNRNGDKVFSSVGYKVPFDGTYKNVPLPVGTYYYIISPGSGRKKVTGSVTIIK
ncbi:MAG: PKD domain-containing protein [Sphingobacteriales bacterium]|nr:MAG: PKD domain-containing protein [Sphingobacteriales bacterium]